MLNATLKKYVSDVVQGRYLYFWTKHFIHPSFSEKL